MNLIEASIDVMRRIAKDYSVGEEIDPHWESVLPETQDIFANEVFLTLHRRYINTLMQHKAARIAQAIPPRDISDLDDTVLTLHCWIREAWLGVSDDREFQAFVDSNIRRFIHPPDPLHWVNVSGILLPISEEVAGQIPLSLIERYKQAYFAKHCYAELVRRGRRNEVIKYAFVLLDDFDDLRQEQNEAMQWLCNKSRHIDPDVGEDALQDWLEKLSGLPPHIQMQKVGATLKAISQRAIDIRSKGGEYKPTSLEEEPEESILDRSTEDSNEEMIANEELAPRLLASQKKIEDILSEGSAKLGQRRFKVLQMLAEIPTLTEIAKKLNVSKQTIGRDRDVIKQSYTQIQELLDF